MTLFSVVFRFTPTNITGEPRHPTVGQLLELVCDDGADLRRVVTILVGQPVKREEIQKLIALADADKVLKAKYKFTKASWHSRTFPLVLNPVLHVVRKEVGLETTSNLTLLIPKFQSEYPK